MTTASEIPSSTSSTPATIATLTPIQEESRRAVA